METALHSGKEVPVGGKKMFLLGGENVRVLCYYFFCFSGVVLFELFSVLHVLLFFLSSLLLVTTPVPGSLWFGHLKRISL